MNKRYKIRSRTRFTLFMTITMLLFFCFAGTIFGSFNSEGLEKANYEEVRIQAGDTLWNLAQEFGPDDKDVRKVVYEICKLNNISADGIYPGQTIIIPKYI